MNLIAVLICVAMACLATCAVWAGNPAPQGNDCPLTGAMPDYVASQPQPYWQNRDSQTMRIADRNDETEITVSGAVYKQHYNEKRGKNQGSSLEVMENYKEALQQEGAEIRRDVPGNVIGHRIKDGKEYWINVAATRGRQCGSSRRAVYRCLFRTAEEAGP